ncbi:hypothetical protein CHS0354_014887 [Potamilus streckersoni]|uniref:Uncharacterized protein n=1 Tax=Potamilus streckersoni TaxID=2493646 RepID=A0AAE0RU93_9BIVA|nr:hypothetical protein CHS0354_014887 [Potamilus streckersoni]
MDSGTSASPASVLGCSEYVDKIEKVVDSLNHRDLSISTPFQLHQIFVCVDTNANLEISVEPWVPHRWTELDARHVYNNMQKSFVQTLDDVNKLQLPKSPDPFNTNKEDL